MEKYPVNYQLCDPREIDVFSPNIWRILLHYGWNVGCRGFQNEMRFCFEYAEKSTI